MQKGMRENSCEASVYAPLKLAAQADSENPDCGLLNSDFKDANPPRRAGHKTAELWRE